MSETENSIEELKPRVDLFFTPAGVREDKLKNHRVVVVDVLRTATSITMALSNGARDVIPVATIDGAIDLSDQLARDNVMLCGERDGIIVDGFHIGNSPGDYSHERVRGRTLVFSSTNGAPAIVKAAGAREVIICGFINMEAVLQVLLEQDDPFPIAILCAGKEERFALEDAVCGGMLINRLKSRCKEELRLNDTARAADLLGLEFGGDLQALLKETDHGKYLISIGMESDLQICASESILPVVPILSDGKIVKRE